MLLPVEDVCTISALSVEIHDAAGYASGVRWTLVTPVGETFRLSGWRYAGAGRERKLVTSAPRASGHTELRRTGLTIECASAGGRIEPEMR